LGVLKSRKIFGPERGEVTGKWRRLLNEELYDLCCSQLYSGDQIHKLRWAGHVARMGERRGAYRVSVGRPERKTSVPMTEA
jgi:hypothetical protein